MTWHILEQGIELGGLIKIDKEAMITWSVNRWIMCLAKWVWGKQDDGFQVHFHAINSSFGRLLLDEDVRSSIGLDKVSNMLIFIYYKGLENLFFSKKGSRKSFSNAWNPRFFFLGIVVESKGMEVACLWLS